MDDFTQKVAIVTGGASGIGEALCQEIGRRGAIVVVADINTEGAQGVASYISSTGSMATPAHLDVSQADEVQELIDETVSKHGRLDYMFNNAGIGIAGEMRDMDLALWKDIVNVNLWGIIHGTTSAYQVMVKQGFGHIVNTASVAGLIPVPMETAYATTKYGVVGLSLSLRDEARQLGVKVSVVCPGFIRTGIYDSATVLRVSREDLFAQIPFRLMDATRAAQVILKAVSRNQGVITVPFYARIFWWLYRLHPALLSYWPRKITRDFRALRKVAGG
ncbi:MAG: SDR family oxidoreductase [Deltaproteobacteria bacterium]|nr:SDR family oxidoreductase [Deltaproteobacteria bacterium]